MRWIRGFWMALGMFCGIPLPFHVWDEELTPVMVATLPVVGAVLGVLWWAASLALIRLGAPLMMVAAILTVMPFLLAGFIHLDGFMDTADAHLSRRPALQDRLRILKDPLVGAFAVVMLAILFLLQFAALFTIADNGRFLGLLVAINVISRCCSSMAILTLRHSSESNYAAALGKGVGGKDKVFVGIVAVVVVVVLSVIYAGVVGIVVVLAVVVGYVWAMRGVYKNFSGVSGDLLGYSLVISELCGLIALSLWA